MLLIVGTGIFEPETLREVIVDLNGAELPATAYGILDHEVEFRTVERGFACFLTGIEALFSAGFDNRLLGEVPIFVAADILFLIVGIAQRDLSPEIPSNLSALKM